MALLLVSYPIAIVVDIFKVVVLTKAVLLPIHPFSVVDFLFFGLGASWLSQENSHPMLLIFLELSSVLEILLVEVIDSVAFDPFSPPGADIDISVRKGVLLFN
jgi:hypothetical protein